MPVAVVFSIEFVLEVGSDFLMGVHLIESIFSGGEYLIFELFTDVLDLDDGLGFPDFYAHFQIYNYQVSFLMQQERKIITSDTIQYHSEYLQDQSLFKIQPLHDAKIEHEYLQDAVLFFQSLADDENTVLRKNLKCLLNIKLHYETIERELKCLKLFVETLLNYKQKLLVFPVKIVEISKYKQAEQLANKLKVLTLKGLRASTSSSVTQKYESSIQRCKFFNVEKGKQIEICMMSRKQLSDEIKNIKNCYLIVSARTLKFYTSHPYVAVKYAIEPKFFINFFTDKLLFVDKQAVKFNSNILYCPIVLHDKLTIAEEYLHSLNAYRKNWKALVLTIEVIKLKREEPEQEKEKQQIIYTSYLKTTYSEGRLFDRLTLIRDKIYQFMIFEFLKTVFKAKGNSIEIPLNHNVRLKIHLKAHTHTSKFNLEFINIVLGILKSDKLYSMSRLQIQNKFKYTLEQILISKLACEKNFFLNITTQQKQMFTVYWERSNGFKIQPSKFYNSL